MTNKAMNVGAPGHIDHGTPPGASELKALLADIVSFRDEILIAKRYMIHAFDPMGDARLAYGVVSDQLTALIKRHGG